MFLYSTSQEPTFFMQDKSNKYVDYIEVLQKAYEYFNGPDYTLTPRNM